MTRTIETDVAVVGGGVAGLSTALHLRRRGVAVTVLEKGAAGAQASGVNFGGVRRQGRDLAELPLAQRSWRIWMRLAELIGTDCEFAATGHLKIATSEDECAGLAAYAEAARDYGLALEVMDRKQLHARFPWFSERVAGGSFCPGDGQANPRLVGPAFARAARAAGARVIESCAATEIEKSRTGFAVATAAGREVRAPVLVNAAGAWAGRIAARFGEPVPMEAIGPQMAVSEPIDYFFTPVLGMFPGGIYLRQIPRGNVIFGGGRGDASIESDRSYVRPENTLWTSALAVRLIPRLEGVNLIRVWTGIEGETADGLPALGPSRTTEGLYHAFGFSGHGFQLGPAVGAALAELIVDGRTETPIDAFDIGRFATRPAAAG